jgi:hypothetical protein
MTLICSFGGGLGKTWFQRGYYGTIDSWINPQMQSSCGELIPTDVGFY